MTGSKRARRTLQKLKWDAKKGDGTIALRVVCWLIRIRSGDDCCLAPDLWYCQVYQAVGVETPEPFQTSRATMN